MTKPFDLRRYFAYYLQSVQSADLTVCGSAFRTPQSLAVTQMRHLRNITESRC